MADQNQNPNPREEMNNLREGNVESTSTESSGSDVSSDAATSSDEHARGDEADAADSGYYFYQSYFGFSYLYYRQPGMFYLPYYSVSFDPDGEPEFHYHVGHGHLATLVCHYPVATTYFDGQYFDPHVYPQAPIFEQDVASAEDDDLHANGSNGVAPTQEVPENGSNNGVAHVHPQAPANGVAHVHPQAPANGVARAPAIQPENGANGVDPAPDMPEDGADHL